MILWEIRFFEDASACAARNIELESSSLTPLKQTVVLCSFCTSYGKMSSKANARLAKYRLSGEINQSDGAEPIF